MRHVFKVFGQIIAIERDGGEWRSYLMGPDGKRRPAELAIPSELAHGELAQYLYDIYHESATRTNGDVVEIEKDGDR